MIDLTKGEIKPNWIKNYRVKTLNELRKEFRRESDPFGDNFDWRNRIPLHFTDDMDKYCGLPLSELNITRVVSDSTFHKLPKGGVIFLIADSDDIWEISKAMIKPILNQKIKKLLKI